MSPAPRHAGAADCNGAATERSFYVTAVAANPGITGNRAFAVSRVGTIWENTADGRRWRRPRPR